MKKLNVKLVPGVSVKTNVPKVEEERPDISQAYEFDTLMSKYDPVLYRKLTELPNWNTFKNDMNIVHELVYIVKQNKIDMIKDIMTPDMTHEKLVFESRLQDANMKTKQIEYSVLNESMEGIARSDVKCNRCGGNYISQRIINNRSGDEAQTFHFTCLNKNCNNQWNQKMA